ncbi:hypothetical protein B0H11DRAFT_1745344, partial [Mycena galericulata]
PLNGAALALTWPYVLVGGGQESMNVTTTRREGYIRDQLLAQVYEEEVSPVKGHFGPISINTISVHPPGTCHASGGEDGIVRVHHFDDSYFKAQPYRRR